MSSTPPTIFALGSNGSGQLGLGHTADVDSPTPCRWHGGRSSRPCKIAAGGNHTIILDSDGSAWLAGGAEKLRRRIGAEVELQSLFSKIHFMHPYKFQLIDSFTHIAATWESTTFVCTSGEVFTHGSGSKGELGLGGQCHETNRPELLLSFPPDHAKVVDLAASMSHTVAVLDNGEVWGWGAGRKSQLGEPAQLVWTPRRIPAIPFDAIRVLCGREYTYILGSRPHEQLVLGSDKWSIRSSAPTHIPPWRSVGSSWSSLFVLLEDGKLLRWGRNDRGQLGPGELPPLQQLVVGSEHVVALAADGRVLSWGWSEHGNCGTPFDEKGNVSGRWNVLAADEPLSPLGAGCATSFLVSRPKYSSSIE